MMSALLLLGVVGLPHQRYEWEAADGAKWRVAPISHLCLHRGRHGSPPRCRTLDPVDGSSLETPLEPGLVARFTPAAPSTAGAAGRRVPRHRAGCRTAGQARPGMPSHPLPPEVLADPEMPLPPPLFARW